MNYASIWARLTCCAALAAAGSASAQEWINCQPDAGDAVRVVDYGPDGVRPFEIVTALGSRSVAPTIVAQDAAGRGIGGGTVEIVLPDEPADLQFVQLMPGVTAKRAVVDLAASCDVFIPQLIGSNQPGTSIATLRVIGHGPAIQIPVRAVATSTWVRFDVGPPVVQFFALNQAVGAGAGNVQWSDQQHFGPLAGVPITITAPADDPSLRFANGSNTITVTSDSWGSAGAYGTPTGLGTVDVQARYPDGSLASQGRYVFLNDPTITLFDQAPVEYGISSTVRGVVRQEPYDCSVPAGVRQLLWPVVGFMTGGTALPGANMNPSLGECIAGVLTIPIAATLAGLLPGTYQVTAEMARGQLAALTSAPVQITVVPGRTIQAATGRGNINVSAGSSKFHGDTTRCQLQAADAVAAGSLGDAGPGPANVALPYGALRIRMGACAITAEIVSLPPPPPPPVQQVLLELEEAPDPATVAFAFGPTADQPTPHWYELHTSIAGRLVQFEIEDAALGDQNTTRDDSINALVALGVPKYAAVDGRLQDLWWAGPQETGWGLSIMQHRDVLFGVLFIYDNEGAPRWLVMPGGEWNSTRTSYSGSLYSPRGTPNHANLPATFVAGPAIGTLRLTPASRDTMTLEYTVNGISGSKQIRRQAFGPEQPGPTVRRDDMWWGGPEQSGWGFALAQQYRNYFGVVYTYDHDGSTIWFAAPSLVASESSVTAGPIYRTSGPRWIGVPYDPGALVVKEVGTLGFVFDDPRTGQLATQIEGRISFHQDIYRQPF